MSRKEVSRAGLLKAALAGRVTNAQAARALGLTVRQFQRLKQRVQAEGPGGLVHRSRGRASPRRLSDEIRAQIGTLLQTTYGGFNDCHLTDMLQDDAAAPALHVSRATVRRIRRALGIPAKRRRRRSQGRHRRIPAEAMGALIQVDASPFAWLEERGPVLTLVGAIDDATGTIVGLTFRPTEDLHGYTVVLQQICTTYGVPLTLYGDGINILVRNDAHWTLEEELDGVQAPTHFGRMLQELAIGYIQARSPQAKGRIERLWQTLQDRLVSELRLHQIATLEAANAFLTTFVTGFNRRFARPAATATAAWRPAPDDLELILGCRYVRVVSHDHTVRIGGRRIQIPRDRTRSWAGYRVVVRELLDGDLVVLYHDLPLAWQSFPGPFTLVPRGHPSSDRYREYARDGRELWAGAPAPARASASVQLKPDAAAFAPTPPPSTPAASTPRTEASHPRRSSKPAADHPWRLSSSFSTSRRVFKPTARRG